MIEFDYLDHFDHLLVYSQIIFLKKMSVFNELSYLVSYYLQIYSMSSTIHTYINKHIDSISEKSLIKV